MLLAALPALKPPPPVSLPLALLLLLSLTLPCLQPAFYSSAKELTRGWQREQQL